MIFFSFQDKGRNGRFLQNCSTENLHEQLAVSGHHKFVDIRKVPQNVIDSLMKRQLSDDSPEIPRHKIRRVCNGCISAVTPGATPQTTENIGACQNDPVHVLSGDTDGFVRGLPQDLRRQLAFSLGKVDSHHSRVSAGHLTKQRSLNQLMELDPSEYLNSDNPPLIYDFLTGLSTKSTKSHSVSSYELSKAAETCLALTSHVKIMPFHFREQVLLYSLTRSRLALSLLGSGSPSGSYQTVKAWLRSEDAARRAEGSVDGGVMAVFDNNQVLQRRWQITTNNTVKSSTITMVAFLEITMVNLMYQPEFSPGQWMWSCFPPDGEAMLMCREAIARRFLYNIHLHPWLADVIEEVVYDQCLDANGVFSDSVDVKVSERKHNDLYKTCPNCGDNYMPKRNRLCRSCNTTISAARFKAAQKTREEVTTSRDKPLQEFRVHIEAAEGGGYQVTCEETTEVVEPQSPHAYLGNHHQEQPTKIRMGEPIFLNPCSFDALAVILRDIGRQSGVRRYGGTREWLPVMCDGLPYTLCHQLIERFMHCTACHQHCDGADDVTRHLAHQHDGDETIVFEKEFAWVLLQPGPGHIEMNMLKGFVKLMWSVYWEDMVEVFNFRSENAKKSAFSVSDHHKGFTLARIARESVARELVTPYVRHELCKSDNECDLSVPGFFKYCLTHVENPNYVFLFNTHFEVLDALFAYRAGLRSGHAHLVEAARGSFAKLWSGLHHPMYRQLDTYDAVMSLCMPQALRQQMRTTCSFNTSGIPFTGEGGDFKLEELNKAVQHWVPSVPTDACSNYSHLTKLREQTFGQMGVQDPKSKRSRTPSDITKQVMAFRAVLREREYLSDPESKVPHASLSGKLLDVELVDFCASATKKQQKFIHVFLENRENLTKKQTIPFDEPPIFVTPDERAAYEHITNKTVAEIHTEIDRHIANIHEIEMQAEFVANYEQLRAKKAKKPEFADFHDLVKEFVELQVSVEDLPDDLSCD